MKNAIIADLPLSGAKARSASASSQTTPISPGQGASWRPRGRSKRSWAVSRWQQRMLPSTSRPLASDLERGCEVLHLAHPGVLDRVMLGLDQHMQAQDRLEQRRVSKREALKGGARQVKGDGHTALLLQVVRRRWVRDDGVVETARVPGRYYTGCGNES